MGTFIENGVIFFARWLNYYIPCVPC